MTTAPSRPTVAAISFRDNHNISMDLESVTAIEMGAPMQIDPTLWACELIVRTQNGIVALQMLADTPEKFILVVDDAAQSEEGME